MSFRPATLVVALAIVSGLGDGVWGPVDSVHALDAVIVAVEKLTKLPSLSPENMKKAKAVAEHIKQDVEAAESGKLTKKQAHEKVGSAIKDLTSLETSLSSAVADSTLHKSADTESKMHTLEKQLADKKAELAKVQSLMKLLKLKKQLAEKKMALQRLVEQKSGTETSRKAQEEKAVQTNAMVEKLLMAARTKINGTQGVDTMLADIQAHEQEVSADLTKLDAAEKKSESSVEALLKQEMPTQGKGDALAKGQSMVKRLVSEARRKFHKAMAVKNIELKELKEAEASIKAHDPARLEKTLANVQREGRMLHAKSGDFLH